MKFAVVGGGWAGMAAADTLVRAGHTVTVFELAHQLGGRARGLQDPALGCIDNGQHLLIGAYQQTLRLIASAHGEYASTARPFVRQPLSLRSANGSLHLHIPSWPSGSLGRLIALATARGLSLVERWQAIRLLANLRLGRAWPGSLQTVSQWLDQHRQAESLQSAMWIPLCLATMNTPPEAASAELFAKVLKDSLLASDSGATDLIIPACDLTRLWIDVVAARVEVVYGTRVQRVTPSPFAEKRVDSSTSKCVAGVEIESRRFDGCVIATPPSGALHIVQNWLNSSDASIRAGEHHNTQRSERLVKALAEFSFLPITTCYMELTSPLHLPYPMLMLRSGHPPCDDRSAAPGQWVFDRNAIDTSPETPARLAFVISHAGQEDLNRHTLPEILLQQLLAELSRQPSLSAWSSPEPPKILASRIITDKRATFAATPGLERPEVHTDWPCIKLAGDWTDTGYPAVLEGAVISGITAANALMKSSAASNSAQARTA